ncbi:glycosyltransferase family 4 protein [Maribacter chungangensis]|uniref:Glycosyltransferase family 4 protein n=1 Tax=Maribacter chungangensis TaxID=1069117 RepID=A0ABW3B5C1_9FLAO
MILIFWQNIVSPHQLPYIQNIARVNNKLQVILVAAEEMSAARKRMGWGVEKISNINTVEIIVSPRNETIKLIYKKYPNAQHFFSGLRANPTVFYSFKHSLNYDVKRHLITEGPTFYLRPKFLHLIRTIFQDKKYFKYIDKVFAIGEDAREWYRLWGFKPNTIIPFVYCVENHNSIELNNRNNEPTLKLLFVGSLIKLKGINNLLKKLSFLKTDIHLDIIGGGNELDNLKEIVNENNIQNKVSFIGVKTNYETRSLMHNYDCLVLPSLYDGWGAVVNEGLMAGLFVICSDQCGAKDLINKWNGIVFSNERKNNLLTALTYCRNNIDIIRAKRNKIKEWSKCIAPESISSYFSDVLSSQKVPIPPWEKDN